MENRRDNVTAFQKYKSASVSRSSQQKDDNTEDLGADFLLNFYTKCVRVDVVLPSDSPPSLHA